MNDIQKKEFAKLFKKYHFQIVRYIMKKKCDTWDY